MANTKHGDFTNLAQNYSKYRPNYSESALNAILALVDKPINDINFIDVGAGTGIWTRMVASRGCKTSIAVEPNDNMRKHGEEDSAHLNISWKNGNGEKTGLNSESADLITMASSFHWVNFEQGLNEFHRVLRSNGRFTALWNPRFIAANPLLMEIENTLYEMAPQIKRVSSGSSGLTDCLTEKLNNSPLFDDVIYIEGRHIAKQTPEHYIGIWNSVNDIRYQAGEKIFSEFIQFIEKKTKDLESIETTYLSRCWSARKT